MKQISADDVAQALGQSIAPTLLDGRLADDFEASHLPTAKNNAVFEVAFVERLPTILPDKDQAIVIYGASAESQEARMAAEKLERADYDDLLILEAGTEAWTQTDNSLIVGSLLPATPPAPEGALELDLEEYQLEWLGRNLINKHAGTIAITSGYLECVGCQLRRGKITFDLRSLKCTDLEGHTAHDILIAHLFAQHFLDAVEHPECRLVIRSAETMPEPTTSKFKEDRSWSQLPPVSKTEN